MSSHENIRVHIVEIRHNGPTIQFQVDSPVDHVSATVISADGQAFFFDEQAKKIHERLSFIDGVTGKFATIELPPLSLENIEVENPRKTVTLGEVCDRDDLFVETKLAGAVGAIFTAEDVRDRFDELDIEEFDDLTDDEKDLFIEEHWRDFTQYLVDNVIERGNESIQVDIGTNFEEAIASFKDRHQLNPGF
jgi:hypothetical protein